ncbi:MAG TPA: post-COAP-1 domain-containing protein [Pyrinomonadaceae bacterium]|jgi:hypothetical protein
MINSLFPRLALRLFAIAAFALLVCAQTQTLRAQGTLNGETLKAAGSNPAAFNANLNCVQGGVASLTFETTGIATGPYPGTYVESGSVTFQNNPGGPVLSFSSTFTITSGSTVITGTKQFAVPTPPPNFGACQLLPNGPATNDTLSLNFPATYTATIPVAPGEFVIEQGTSRVFAQTAKTYIDPANPLAQFYSFNETFINPTVVARVTLTPAAAVNPVGTSHTVTATATSANNTGVPGTRILFTVTPGDDSAPVTGLCVTNANGQCDFTYQGPEFPRTDAIRGCADSNQNGTIEVTEPCGAATKEFVFPVSTPGQATGGGRLFDAPSGISGINFGFNFRSDGTNLQGNCLVNDKTRDTMVRCLDVIAFVQDANHATIYGTAEVNGTESLYKIDVLDNHEPGAGYDFFTIVTQNGYTASGLLTEGNIQTHPPQ